MATQARIILLEPNYCAQHRALLEQAYRNDANRGRHFQAALLGQFAFWMKQIKDGRVSGPGTEVLVVDGATRLKDNFCCAYSGLFWDLANEVANWMCKK